MINTSVTTGHGVDPGAGEAATARSSRFLARSAALIAKGAALLGACVALQLVPFAASATPRSATTATTSASRTGTLNRRATGRAASSTRLVRRAATTAARGARTTARRTATTRRYAQLPASHMYDDHGVPVAIHEAFDSTGTMAKFVTGAAGALTINKRLQGNHDAQVGDETGRYTQTTFEAAGDATDRWHWSGTAKQGPAGWRWTAGPNPIDRPEASWSSNGWGASREAAVTAMTHEVLDQPMFSRGLVASAPRPGEARASFFIVSHQPGPKGTSVAQIRNAQNGRLVSVEDFAKMASSDIRYLHWH